MSLKQTFECIAHLRWYHCVYHLNFVYFPSTCNVYILHIFVLFSSIEFQWNYKPPRHISESLQWNYKPPRNISESLHWNYKPLGRISEFFEVFNWKKWTPPVKMKSLRWSPVESKSYYELLWVSFKSEILIRSSDFPGGNTV